MSDRPLSSGKTSSEFILTAGLIVAYIMLVWSGEVSGASIDDLITLGMVYIGGRALPKTAEQVKNLGRNKEMDALVKRALEKETKE